MTDEGKMSRRYVLTAVAGMASGVAIIGTTPPAQAAKAPQKAVKYQDTPKGDQACENCALFEAPSSCKTVDGTISPQGWCMVYAKKPA
jgi:High potential iron-sulfur protein